MTGEDRIPDDEWRLDDESIERAEPEPESEAPTAGLTFNLSDLRLAHAVYVVTAEHLAWYLVAAYALVTRMVALGARPLDPAPARGALAAFAVAQHGSRAFALADASWVAIVQGWLFAAVGASDAGSRIVVTACGLLMVAVAFAMRPALGRAGALGLAALLAISPGITYFSRGGSTAIASMTFMMIAIAIAESMRRRPGFVRAAALGAALALWLSADPIGYVTAAATVASLILAGIANLVRIDHRRLRLRVWWERRSALVFVCALVAAGLWLVLTTGYFHRPLAAAVVHSVQGAFAPLLFASRHALHRFLPVVAFYEFVVTALAIVGAFAIVSRRIGDRFAAWSIVWALVTIAILATVGANPPDAVVAIILPLAVVGAYAVAWMHALPGWTSIRYALAAGLALTLHVQLAANFVHPAPDASEASWRRHALLFWSEPATTIQTVRECERARSSVSTVAGATAMIPDDAPQVQWYLRDITPAASPDNAGIVVTLGTAQSGALAGNPDSPRFGFEEWWTPDFRALTPAAALKYFVTQRVWSDVVITDLEIATPHPRNPAP